MLEVNAGVDTLDTNSEVSPIVYNSTAAALTTAAYNTIQLMIQYIMMWQYHMPVCGGVQVGSGVNTEVSIAQLSAF